jgi:hypothetical protein
MANQEAMWFVLFFSPLYKLLISQTALFYVYQKRAFLKVTCDIYACKVRVYVPPVSLIVSSQYF